MSHRPKNLHKLDRDGIQHHAIISGWRVEHVDYHEHYAISFTKARGPEFIPYGWEPDAR